MKIMTIMTNATHNNVVVCMADQYLTFCLKGCCIDCTHQDHFISHREYKSGGEISSSMDIPK